VVERVSPERRRADNRRESAVRIGSAPLLEANRPCGCEQTMPLQLALERHAGCVAAQLARDARPARQPTARPPFVVDEYERMTPELRRLRANRQRLEDLLP
jgi:hypothetical protein